MKNKNYEMDMCRGSLLRKVISFSLPLMLTGILQLFYNAADIIVVGRFAGKEALAAVGSTSSLINLLINIFIGLSVGTSVTVAQHYGAGDRTGVGKAVHTSITLALIGGFGLGILGFVLARPLLGWMGSPADVIGGASLYMRIYFIGMPANLLYTFGSAILRAVGDTRRPLVFLTIAGIINVILNLVFVLGFHIDVAGVALATIISQAVSAVLVLRCLVHTTGTVRLIPKELRMHRQSLAMIMRIGLPAGLQGTLFSVSNVLIQSSVNSFGSAVMAGNATSSSLEGFVYTAMNSIYQACLTFVGQNRGAGQYARVRRILWVCLLLVTGVGVVSGGLFILLGPQLISIYNADPQVIQYGVQRLNIICSLYFLCGVMEVLVGQLRGLGYSMVPMIATLISVCVFRIVWVYTVFVRFPSVPTLMWSYPVSWIIAALFHLCTYLVVLRKLPKEDAPMNEASCAC